MDFHLPPLLKSCLWYRSFRSYDWAILTRDQRTRGVYAIESHDAKVIFCDGDHICHTTSYKNISLSSTWLIIGRHSILVLVRLHDNIGFQSCFSDRREKVYFSRFVVVFWIRVFPYLFWNYIGFSQARLFRQLRFGFSYKIAPFTFIPFHSSLQYE